MLSIPEMFERTAQIRAVRDQIKQLTETKDKLEAELAESLKEVYPDQATVVLNNVEVKRTPSMTYSLNEAGTQLLSTYTYDSKFWKKEPDMKTIRADKEHTFDNYIVANEGKMKLSFKDVVKE